MAHFGDMIQEYHVKKFRRQLELRRARLADLATPEAALGHIVAVKRKISRAFPLPAERSELAPVIAGTLIRPNFRVEKIVFHSRPAFPVTANLYLPARMTGKVPGVLMLCGHNPAGKAAGRYQKVCQSLAIKGCAVLTPDPIGQGERRQYPDHPEIMVCAEHNFLHRRMLPAGDSIGVWLAWDATRSLDYLFSRPEVDPSRVGVTGNSGGGTLTSILGALDDRIAAAAPGCYITRWLSNVENELPADAEQMPAGLAADGGDMADLLLAAAPRPTLLLAQRNDAFDLRGTRDIYEELRSLYRILGKEKDIRLQVGPGDHGYFKENREAAYAFFIERFGLDADGVEPPLELFRESELFCAPSGRAIALPGTRTIQDFIGERVAGLRAGRPPPDRARLRAWLLERLALPSLPPDGGPAPHYRQLRPRRAADGRVSSRYGIESEEGLLATLHLLSPDTEYFHLPALDPAELYLPHQDALAELAARAPASSGPVFGLDYRGVGESMPNGCQQDGLGGFFAFFGVDYHYAALSAMLGESWLGGRVRDALAAIRLLHAAGCRKISLSASGIGRVPALLAAFLSEIEVGARLDGRPPTYAHYAVAPPPAKWEDEYPQSMVVPGMLNVCDLDDLSAR